MLDTERTKCLYVICGPSGSGKSTLGASLELLDFKESKSYTTRKCRDKADKAGYHFISAIEFEEMIAAGRFIEWTEYAGNYYGTTFSELDASDYAILELNGMEAVKSKYTSRPVKVIGLSASVTTITRRLRRRPDKSIERIKEDGALFRNLSEISDLYVSGLTKRNTLLHVLSFVEACEHNKGARF